MDPEEREETIFHGTTFAVAQRICATKAFNINKTWFASERDLAAEFAHRSSSKQGRGHGPAIVKVVLYESDLQQWKRNRLVHSEGFDEGDRPEFRGRTQLIFSAEGIRLLNIYMFSSELAIETLSRNG